MAKLAVGDWIERVYNRRRRHSTSVRSARSTSKTGSIKRHKPPDPVLPNGLKPMAFSDEMEVGKAVNEIFGCEEQPAICYQTTDAAAGILRDGFRDATGSYMLVDIELTGVWLARWTSTKARKAAGGADVVGSRRLVKIWRREVVDGVADVGDSFEVGDVVTEVPGGLKSLGAVATWLTL